MQKIDLLFSICFDENMTICTVSFELLPRADPLATKLGLIVHYQKPEYFMEKLDRYVQSQGHNKISKCQ